MTAALAFKFDEIEADASLVADATKECFDCDPDNPRGVPTDKCATCGGTGRQALAAAQIAEELGAARAGTDGGDGAPKEKPSADGGDDDEYLEY